MSQPKYGAREGLADRLDDWIHRLGTDRSLPWPGLGLIADLRTARNVLAGVPETAEAPAAKENWLDPQPGEAKLEFDL